MLVLKTKTLYVHYWKLNLFVKWKNLWSKKSMSYKWKKYKGQKILNFGKIYKIVYIKK